MQKYAYYINIARKMTNIAVCGAIFGWKGAWGW